jgi:hypothetical protein
MAVLKKCDEMWMISKEDDVALIFPVFRPIAAKF